MDYTQGMNPGPYNMKATITMRRLGTQDWENVTFFAEGNAPKYLCKHGAECHLRRPVTVRQLTYNNFEVNDGENLFYVTVLP